MVNEKTNDTDYKLFQAILTVAKSCEDQSEIIFDKRQKFELILFFYAYSFDKLYELKPEFEDLIWREVQCNVFGYLNNYAKEKGIDNYFDFNIGEFINKRGATYFSEVECMKSERNYIPTKLVYSIFESPLETDPSDSFDLTNELKLQSILAQPLSYLNTVAKKVIDYDFNFGNDLKYKEIIDNIKNNGTYEALEIVYTHTDECKKLYHPSKISGGFPRGREFIEAAKSVKKLQNSKDHLLIGSLIVFEKWMENYLDKYGINSIPKEQMLLIEHQILQAYQRLN